MFCLNPELRRADSDSLLELSPYITWKHLRKDFIMNVQMTNWADAVHVDTIAAKDHRGITSARRLLLPNWKVRNAALRLTRLTLTH